MRWLTGLLILDKEAIVTMKSKQVYGYTKTIYGCVKTQEEAPSIP